MDWRRNTTVGITPLALTREQINFLLASLTVNEVTLTHAEETALATLRHALRLGLADCDRADEKVEKLRQERAKAAARYQAKKAEKAGV